ncbi:MAG: tetratricopeptide repeat protein, partial [Myxococcota bacterium]|nr:tetratricopeptide repeat protein [Myxococcota bacterium]
SLLADAAEHEARFGGGPHWLDRAVEARRRAAEARRGDARLRRATARTLVLAGRMEEAAAALAEAARLDPRSPVGALAQTRLALRRGERGAAASGLHGALDRHPRARGELLLAALHDTADPALVRGAPVDGATKAGVLARSGFGAEAAAELERLFDARPADPRPALDAARLYRRAGDEAAARRVLERAARLHPDDARLARGPGRAAGGGAR